MMRKRRRALPFGLTALLLSFGAAVASGQYEDRRGAFARGSYERLRRSASELDQAARRAAEQAIRDQYRLREKDEKFLRSVQDFARRARAFDDRLSRSRMSPGDVDEELQRLGRDSRNVQQRIERARFADRSTRQEWERVLRLLDRMVAEYRGGFRERDRRGLSSSGVRGDEDGRQSPRILFPDVQRNMSEMNTLARDLEERAARARYLAERGALDGAGVRSMALFHEQARRFRGSLENRVPTPEDLRRDVSELVAEAQSVESSLRSGRTRPQLETEWRSIEETLERMRHEVGV